MVTYRLKETFVAWIWPDEHYFSEVEGKGSNTNAHTIHKSHREGLIKIYLPTYLGQMAVGQHYEH